MRAKFEKLKNIENGETYMVFTSLLEISHPAPMIFKSNSSVTIHTAYA